MQRKSAGLGGIAVRMPTLEEWTACYRDLGSREEEAARKLVKACLVSPSLSDLRKRYPSCTKAIVEFIFSVYGADVSAEDLAEDELEGLGEAFLGLYVAEKEKSEKLGKSDDLLVLRVLTPIPGDDPLVFLCRRPRDIECDEFSRDRLSFHKAKAFVKRLCIHGPLERVETEFSGMWMPLAARLLNVHGRDEELTLDLA